MNSTAHVTTIKYGPESIQPFSLLSYLRILEFEKMMVKRSFKELKHKYAVKLIRFFKKRISRKLIKTLKYQNPFPKVLFLKGN